MLSYQHEYHAGNHADVLKHAALATLIRALQGKPTPLRVIDCHAGSGVYDLQGDLAQRGREFETGIGRIFAAAGAPEAILPYLDVVLELNPDRVLRRYPGSPEIALRLLRPTDQLELFELHPRAIAALRSRYGREPRVHVHSRDAFEGLVGVVPPNERRGIALIDPAYETSDEYRRVPEIVAAALSRWANGIFLVWYPRIRRAGTERLLAELSKLDVARRFRVELSPCPESAGLTGSGLVILNPPYQADLALVGLLRWLDAKLGSSMHSRWSAGWI